MTVLQTLNKYYDRMAARGEAEAPGFSREKISFAIVLSPDGALVDMMDCREAQGKKLLPRLMEVPAAVKRASGILPNILWDKTAYSLGCTKDVKKRTEEEHAAFKVENLKFADTSTDKGLIAFKRFMKQWDPARFNESPFTSDMLDTNVVFRLDGDDCFIHERSAVKHLLAAHNGADSNEPEMWCLVTGTKAPIRRLHTSIKGVEGAQSSGASLISFNLDAFTSYAKEKGDNAPVSEIAAFRYSAALNRMLERGSRNRLPRPIGDTSIIFWADTSGTVGEPEAKAAEDFFAAAIQPPAEMQDINVDALAAVKIRDELEKIAKGHPVCALDLGLAKGVRFHVLGLAPNAARLSIRYWLDNDFDFFAQKLAEHYADLAIVPAPWGAAVPSVQRLLVKTTALQEKFDRIPPFLAGEMMRAVLSGQRYPRTLLSAVIMRLRAGDAPTGWHAAAIRAVLMRDNRLKSSKEKIPMSLEKDSPDTAYQLGRMFAILETAQKLALGKTSTTIRDRYFGAASATPASIFPILLRGVQNHLGKLRKDGKGGWIEREIEEIFGHLPTAFPRTFALEAQGRFVIGYYHQREARFAGRPNDELNDVTETEGDEHDND